MLLNCNHSKIGVPTFKSPDWWSPYNRVKHERIDNFRNANLKNVANALAGLYILELYLVKFIGNRDRDLDVPNDISKLEDDLKSLIEHK